MTAGWDLHPHPARSCFDYVVPLAQQPHVIGVRGCGYERGDHFWVGSDTSAAFRRSARMTPRKTTVKMIASPTMMRPKVAPCRAPPRSPAWVGALPQPGKGLSPMQSLGCRSMSYAYVSSGESTSALESALGTALESALGNTVSALAGTREKSNKKCVGWVVATNGTSSSSHGRVENANRQLWSW